ncbi:MAG: hypothetical protein ACRCZE_00835, partial [Candidatus Altimarinota bacterium]
MSENSLFGTLTIKKIESDLLANFVQFQQGDCTNSGKSTLYLHYPVGQSVDRKQKLYALEKQEGFHGDTMANSPDDNTQGATSQGSPAAAGEPANQSPEATKLTVTDKKQLGGGDQP